MSTQVCQSPTSPFAKRSKIIRGLTAYFLPSFRIAQIDKHTKTERDKVVNFSFSFFLFCFAFVPLNRELVGGSVGEWAGKSASVKDPCPE